MNLCYVLPTIKNWGRVAQLVKKKVDFEMKKWMQSVILYVVGQSPSIIAIQQFFTTQCSTIDKPEICYHNGGYFIGRMTEIEDRDAISIYVE